jgi:hypothetical protein
MAGVDITNNPNTVARHIAAAIAKLCVEWDLSAPT